MKVIPTKTMKYADKRKVSNPHLCLYAGKEALIDPSFIAQIKKNDPDAEFIEEEIVEESDEDEELEDKEDEEFEDKEDKEPLETPEPPPTEMSKKKKKKSKFLQSK